MTDINAYDAAPEGEFRDYVALLKPRVMSLVVFTAFVGLFVAPVDVHPFIAFCSVLFIALGGGASGALNMWYDRDIDAIMNRTQSRPIPSGRVEHSAALGLGLVLSIISVMMLGLVANWFAAGFLAFTIFFYAVVYTVWLKRWTPQNIVIGGAAGAFPPMIGWACATGGISIESLLMFALVFFWTPPHFWALALFMKEDYHNAGVPMLTVTHGRRAARRHIFAYTLVLAPFALWLGVTSVGGPLYMAVAVVLNAAFIRGGWQVLRRDEDAAIADGYLVERRVFKLSLYYLFLHFLALLVQSWMGGW
ncbi:MULTISPECIES: heme o synthase [Paracoccus]|jgi:protoheme IX farnesyltransferase|uniref:Protoheme IX farnesyltransferase n=1 Tax=Paracoccus marcusii TaxID=59779 RepID=A0ABY7UST0_9RHOB|nr:MULTISPECIES: heme o synthase [Paracoccus]TYP67096.1 protoheme IX farnesyltransferase [Stutzerimonas stutzeri]AZY94852.1 protoheme IX farnesyltransferase [Paracoccus sp. Arc7-R13]KIX16874.1 protoheme IX farnesyltransferase [Paracoccus sp. 228]MBF5079584.1 protoheme IX farnesyltransferase [Paracoccus sp. NBH48]QXI62918.1 Protoheme IX farnesyltransferase [Paracoccus marcusii]|tara:strand:- start:2388 stop:3305 length:918 start_codon:yes stop_codon:yes gene_type:complete